MLFCEDDKGLNGIAKLVITGETGTSECLTGEQAEPNLDRNIGRCCDRATESPPHREYLDPATVLWIDTNL